MMRNIKVEVNNQGIFVIAIRFEVGSVHEGDKEHGLSHFLEHLLFKTKEQYNVEELLIELNALGGVFNAITDKDYTCFYIKTTTPNFAKSIELIKAIAFDPSFTTQDLSKERRVVLEEFHQDEDDYESRVLQAAYRMLLQNAYAKDVKGTVQCIKSATLKQVKAFYKEHYRNPSVFVSCCKSVKENAEDALSHLPIESDTLSKARTIQTKFERDIGCTMTPIIEIMPNASLHQYAIGICFRSYPSNDKDNIILDFIWDVLAGGLNALLKMEMREKRGLVYGLKAFNDTYTNDGVTGIYFTTTSPNIKDAIDHILTILENVREKGLSKAVLMYSKKSYLNKLLYNLSNFDYKVARQMERFFNRQSWDEADMQRFIQQLDNKDIARVSSEVLDFNKMAIVSYGDFKNSHIPEIKDSVLKMIRSKHRKPQ
jgi:predicted Zn-dependent peptidase